MTCTAFFSIESISDLLVWPITCDYYFYLKILIGIFIVLTWTLYKIEKKTKTEAELLSCAGVISIALIIIGLIGTLIQNADGIAMISSEVLLSILAFTIPIILIWIFKD
jgi:hypothetical protein